MRLEPWVDRALRVIDRRTRERFAQDPVGALTQELGLIVRKVETLSTQREDGGFCDGISFFEDGVILYAPTPHSRRENFTLAHELGHWIVEQDQGLFDFIADQRDPMILLESMCDRLAQRLLLPQALIEGVVGSGPVRARHVQDLFDASTASYQACAIAVAGRIRGLGAVVLVDRRDQRVSHASIRPDPNDGWPVVYPWRGQLLTDGHPLQTLAPGGRFTRRITWRNSWDRTAEFFADAEANGRRTIAVLAAENPWTTGPSYALGPRDFDIRPHLSVFCCGKEQQFRGYPCPNCGQGFCPQCGDCRCDRRAKSEAQCHNCFTLVQSHLLVTGLCESCR